MSLSVSVCLYLCVCVCICAHAMTHVQRLEDNFLQSVTSFYHGDVDMGLWLLRLDARTLTSWAVFLQISNEWNFSKKRLQCLECFSSFSLKGHPFTFSRTIATNSAILLILLSIINSGDWLNKLKWPKTRKLILSMRRDTSSWIHSDPNHKDLGSSAPEQETFRPGHKNQVVKAYFSLWESKQKRNSRVEGTAS